MKGPKLTVLVSGDHHGLLDQLVGYEVAGVLQFADRAQIEPVVVKDSLELGFEEGGLGVPGAGRGPGIFDLLFIVETV